MKIHFTNGFQKRVKKLISQNSLLRQKFKKQFRLFQQNPLHKGLKLHKLKGLRSQQYSIYIEGDLRALAVKNEETFIFFDIVTHDQY